MSGIRLVFGRRLLVMVQFPSNEQNLLKLKSVPLESAFLSVFSNCIDNNVFNLSPGVQHTF